jgi:uncharacterized Zn finger protein
MKKITYQVQGTAAEPYSITISLEGTNLTCLCDCQAGMQGKHCKHWMSVFEGKKQDYIGLNDAQIDEIQSWLSGSELEQRWIELNRVLEEEEAIKKKKTAAYKALDKEMKN